MKEELMHIIHKNKIIINRRIIVLMTLLIAVGVLIVGDRYEYVKIPESYLNAVRIIATIIISFLFASLFLKFTEKRVFNFFKNEIDIEQRIFITKMYKMAVNSIPFAIVLSKLGVSMQNITIFLGFIATGIALAMKEILMSYFVWLMIIIKRFFKIGDYIKFGDISGTIVRIDTMFTTLQYSFEDSHSQVKLPNKILLDRAMINFGQDEYILDHIKIPLKNIPARMEKKLDLISAAIARNLPWGPPLNRYLDVDNNIVMLIITYKVPLAHKLTAQTVIIATVSGVLKDSIRY